MPNGVIWGGAVEGSNQLGAMVTCQAMAASPAAGAASAGARSMPNAMAVSKSARRMYPSQAGRRVMRLLLGRAAQKDRAGPPAGASALGPGEFLLGFSDLRRPRDEVESGH